MEDITLLEGFWLMVKFSFPFAILTVEFLWRTREVDPHKVFPQENR